VQEADASERQTPFPLQGQGPQQLVLGRFGSPIAIPTAQVVIANAADAGRQGGKPTQLAVVQSRGNGFGQQDGSKGIDAEGLLKPTAFNGLQAFFGPTTTVVQPTSSVDDQAQRRVLLQPAAELLKIAVITEIQTGLTASAEGQHGELRAVVLQQLGNGSANAPLANDQSRPFQLLQGGWNGHRTSGALSHDGQHIGLTAWP